MMSLLPDIKRRRCDAIVKQNSKFQLMIQPLIDEYNKEKESNFSILKIDKALRDPLIVDTFWQKIKKDEKAFLVYGIPFEGDKTYLKFLNSSYDDLFSYESIEKQRFYEIHFVRSSAESIAEEIGDLFVKASQENITKTDIRVDISEISCFKHMKKISIWEMQYFRFELQELVGTFEFKIDERWREFDFSSLKNFYGEITQIRIEVN